MRVRNHETSPGDGRSLYDSFQREWTLLVLGRDPPDTRPFTHAAAALALDLQVVHHPQPALRELYAAPLALIRPDQILAWRGPDAGEAARVLRVASGG